MIKLSVIIPSHADAPRLRDCLESVIKYAEVDEVILVHSGGQRIDSKIPDDPRIRLVFEEKSLYAGAARNRGAALAKNELLVFLDSDCLWSETWMSELHRAIQERPDFQALNGMILYEQPGNSWAFALHLLEFHEFLGKREYRPKFLSSGNLVIQKNCFKESGGYREDIPMCTDFTFGARFSSSTRKMFWYRPKLSIVHTEHLTGFEEIKRKTQAMGYWRALVSSSSTTSSLSTFLLKYTHPALLMTAFFGVIYFRAIRRLNFYMYWFFILSPKIFRLVGIWSYSARATPSKRNHQARQNQQNEN